VQSALENIVVTGIEDITTVYSPKGRRVSIRDRDCFGLSFCTGGQITYIHEGRTYVSDRTHAVILPEGQSYSLTGDRTGAFPLIDFKCEGFFCPTHMVIPIGSPEPYLADYEQMRALSLFGGNRLKLLGIFYGMLQRLTASVPEKLAPALRCIEERYREPGLSNEELAMLCGVSEVYFRRLFTARYGVTPRQFLIDVRVNRAKQLLSEGVLKISAVSEQCGFSNPYHFCRTFRERVGVTPTEYMESNRVVSI